MKIDQGNHEKSAKVGVLVENYFAWPISPKAVNNLVIQTNCARNEDLGILMLEVYHLQDV